MWSSTIGSDRLCLGSIRQSRIFVMNPDGTGARRIVSAPSNDERPLLRKARGTHRLKGEQLDRSERCNQK